jgi:hypothetical protein
VDSHDKSEPVEELGERAKTVEVGMPFRPEEIIVHVDQTEAYASWESLALQGRQPAQAIWKSLQSAVGRLRSNAQWGDVVRQASIPSYFRERYGLSNLYCVDLAAYHRCFYTIANRSVILLEIVDHPTYDRWFPGKRRR